MSDGLWFPGTPYLSLLLFGPSPLPADLVRFNHDKEKPYVIEALAQTDDTITVRVPATAALEKPGYGGLRVREIYDTGETVFSNPLPFFPIANGLVENIGPLPAIVTILPIKPVVGDYPQLPSSKTFYLAPGDVTSLDLVTGFTYEVRANLTQTVDIMKLSPDGLDFRIQVQ